MQIRYHCPNDTCVAIIEYEPLEELTDPIECPRCHQQHPIGVSEEMRRHHRVDECAVCGRSELFVRKDFPQRLGVLIVVVFGLVAIYYFRVSVIKAWSVLVAAAVIDLVIYQLVGKVTMCYACRAEYRKCSLNPNHEGFDLATSDKY